MTIPSLLSGIGFFAAVMAAIWFVTIIGVLIWVALNWEDHRL